MYSKKTNFRYHHQLLLNIDKETSQLVDQIIKKVHCPKSYVVERVFTLIANHGCKGLNKSIYEELKQEDYSDCIENDEKYRANFNYFQRGYMPDYVYNSMIDLYESKSNEWFHNRMRYFAFVFCYYLKNNYEQVLNFNE